MTCTPAPSRRGPVPGHVAWVARQAGEGPGAGEREERALLSLVETALDLGVGRLSVRDPSGGRALRARAAELARGGVAVADAVDDSDSDSDSADSDSADSDSADADADADSDSDSADDDASRPGAARPRDLVHLEKPALRVLLAQEGSGRAELVGAVRELAARGVLPKKVSETAISGALAVPDVDLLVLTGDDRRVPDLLIWQAAYSEIVVLPDPWPEAAAQFREAVGEYQRRDRRYGGLVASR